MKEVLARVGPMLRALGFHGASRVYRKRDGDFVFVIEFRAKRVRASFCVSLGAQPLFIPSRGDGDLARLRAHDCLLRWSVIAPHRVTGEWPCQMPASLFAVFEKQVTSAQTWFFDRAQTLRSALVVDSPRVLMQKFSTGMSHVEAAATLVRAACSLGHVDKARRLADLGCYLGGLNEFRLVELRSALPGSCPRTPEAWQDFTLVCDVGSIIGRLVKHNGYSSLTAVQRSFYAIRWLEVLVNSYGLAEYFHNGAADDAPQAVTGLRQLGANRTASILTRAMALFPDPGPSLDLGARQEQVKRLSAADLNTLCTLDDEYYERQDAVERLLAEFARQHICPHLPPAVRDLTEIIEEYDGL